MPLGKVSIREVFSRPTRAILTFLAIMLGVAAVVAVFLTTANTRVAQREMLRAVSGKADLEIKANSDRGFPFKFVQAIRETPGVELAAPSLNRFTVLFYGEKKAKARILGIDPKVDQQVRDYKIVEGREIQKSGEVLVDGSFARSLGIKVDTTLKVLTRAGRPEETTVVGMVMPSGGSGVAVGSSLYAILPDVAKWMKIGASVDDVQIVLADDKEIDKVTERLKSVVPAEVTIRPPATRSQMTEEAMFSTENGLHMAIAFALLIALFLIYNTFQMSVGERRKQLGIMRALGTTRSQIRWMILREALIMSLVASAFGCALGIFGATYLSRVVQQVQQVSLPVIQITVWPLVVAVLFGVTVSLVGAYLPANRAASVQPLEAIRQMDTGQNSALVRISTPFGVIAICIGGFVLWLATQGRLPLGGDVVGIVTMLLGFVMLIPISLASVSLVLLKMMRPFFGPAALLAQRQLTRHLGRSTLTIGVLFVAVSTSLGLAGNILDNVGNIRKWYSGAMKGDFFVRATSPDLTTGAAADMPDESYEAVKNIAGVQDVFDLSTSQALSGDDDVLVVSRDFRGAPLGLFQVERSQQDQIVKALTQGQVVIGSVLAQRKKIEKGGTLQLQTSSGPTNFDVAGVVNDYLAGGLTVYMDKPVARLALGMEGFDMLIVKAEPGRVPEVDKALREYCNAQGLVLQSNPELVAMINGIVNAVIACLWALLAIGCLIAAMGLVNTLTMNILEQTREIGMLRTVAMTRSQTRSMILAQAIIIGVLGIIPGVAVGVFVSYAISLSAGAILGHDIQFAFHPWLVGGSVLLGLAIVLFSSLIPAERAARVKLSSALQYE